MLVVPNRTSLKYYEMRIFSNSPTLFVIALLFAALGQGNSCQSIKVTHMPEKRADRIPAGVWGGNHVNLEVTDESAMLEFDCAHGSINQPILLDERGRFDAKGTYVAEGHGPARQGAEPESAAARYYGSVSGDTMTLTVELSGASGMKSSYTLTSGRQGKLWKCG